MSLRRWGDDLGYDLPGESTVRGLGRGGHFNTETLCELLAGPWNSLQA